MSKEVKCSKCGKVVGFDSIVTVIKSCALCTKSGNKFKKDKQKPKSEGEAFSNTKKGPAADLPSPKDKIVFRSGWERNFARYLTHQKINWEYEKLVYPFKTDQKGKSYKNGPFQYMPDFRNLDDGTIWEIKGYFRSEDKSKIRRFKLLYPDDFKFLKVCISRNNKKAKEFYSNYEIEILYIEDLNDFYKKKIEHWE